MKNCIIWASLTVAALSAATATGADAAAQGQDDPLNIIVPFDFGSCSTYERGLRDLRRLHDEFGVRRVVITGYPGAKMRLAGWTEDMSDADRFGDLLARITHDLSGSGLSVGWWCAPTLRYTMNAPFQRMVAGDGRESPFASCLLDPRASEDLARRIERVAARARPPFILFEDDFNYGPRQAGPAQCCYCRRHLDDVAARCGRAVTREELYAICRNPTEANRAIRLAFAESLRDSLAALGKSIRAAVDRVSPETRMGLCAGRDLARDGGFIIAFARAVAGPGRPFLRIPSTTYASDGSLTRLLGLFGPAAYAFEHIPPDFEAVQELDTYPHNRFFMPDSHLDTYHVLGILHGSQGALYYGTQYSDDPLEQDGYFGILKERRAFLAALREAVRGKPLVGIQTVHTDDLADPRRHQLMDGLSYGHLALARLGFPYTSREQPVKLVIGTEASMFSADAARRLLEKGGVLLDAPAAADFTARGLADLIGAHVSTNGKFSVKCERLRPAAGTGRLEGQCIVNLGSAPATADQRCMIAEISGLVAGTETLVDYIGPYGEVLGPSLCRFTNAAGGRVAVMGTALRENRSVALFNYRTREALRVLFGWLGRKPLPVAVADEANVGVWVNAAPDGSETLVTVINLRADAVRDIKLFLAPELQSASVEELGLDGTWHPGSFSGDYPVCRARTFRLVTGRRAP